VKALSKKRKQQMARNLSVHRAEASILKYQALWYSSFIAVYMWFLYWVSYDFFVWQKPIAEINPVNYVGAIVAIAFIWAGTKLLKPNRTQTQNLRQKPLPQQAPQKSPPQAALQVMQAPQQAASSPNSTCSHYLGYLYQRQASEEIPAERLTCEKVLQCFSSQNK
jgi:hypothetical protein